ncbi:L,D-transpeptidase [Bifidobacterium sp. CP2]|uniref:L,D-transpeptidase n=1 Tax=Bifidobacterium sp. CP2 TaxID=2809025 RepID=UPI001BDD1BBE|nr:L,D-transpeptidase [Bifidobacterium sp. CP2]MBT1180867.1 L,D-transpeptidase [Bifidobacterium sp. CP2]
MTDGQGQQPQRPAMRPEYGAMREDFEATQTMAPLGMGETGPSAQVRVPGAEAGANGLAGLVGATDAAGTTAKGGFTTAAKITAEPTFTASPADGFTPVAGAHTGMTGGHTAAKGRSRKGLIITLIVAGVLLVALIGAFFGARWYYADRVAPGVRFGSVTMAGQTRDEAKASVKQAIKDTAITVKDSTSGQKTTASLEQLGVSIDVDKTVDALMNAKSSSNLLEDVSRVNPLSHADVALAATTDDAALADYLSEQLIAENERAVPASIAYNAETKAFEASEGTAGKTPDATKAVAAVKQAVAQPGAAATVTIADKTVDAPISLETAQQTADQANARLNNKIVLTNGDAKQVELPVDEVAKWIKAESEPAKGTITLGYDADAIRQYLSQQLPGQLNQEMVSQTDIVDNNGTVIIAAETKGVNGVTIKDTDKAADAVLAALQKGEGATVQVDADVTKFDTKQKVSEWRLVVDKSAQNVTVYQNGNVVKTFNVCTGKASTQTDNGTFYVYLKYKTQTMRGEDYVTPNVRWVTYFNGGEGFHSAPWNYSAIARGDPVNHGSHGCVNMYDDDANWIYTNIPDGAVVQVVGSQPTSAVR